MTKLGRFSSAGELSGGEIRHLNPLHTCLTRGIRNFYLGASTCGDLRGISKRRLGWRPAQRGDHAWHADRPYQRTSKPTFSSPVIADVASASLDGFKGVKKGQLAHLNKRADDNRPENLVWLCLEHHDSFDSVTSQSKNFTLAEVTRWRDRLHAHFAESSSGATPTSVALSSSGAPNRAWRYPWFSTSDRPQLFPDRSRNRVDGVCVIERILLEDGRAVVACISVPGNPGNSITNTVETICEQVCLQFEIEPEDVVWLENYEYINPTEWLRVTFRTMPPDGWDDPEWTEMTQAMWENLGLKPVR